MYLLTINFILGHFQSWESGWYAEDSVSVTPSISGASYQLVGAADWANYAYTPGSHKVVLEIQDSSVTGSFYVIYNRAKGPNGGVTFAKDKVTISLGQSRKVSWHQAELPAPTSSTDYPLFRKASYNGGAQDLVVKVCGMTSGIEGSTPDVASVLIYLDDGLGGVLCPGEQPSGPTPNPTANPTAAPPPPGTYLLACGSSAHWNGDCGGQTAAADTAEPHEVRCCKDS